MDGEVFYKNILEKEGIPVEKAANMSPHELSVLTGYSEELTERIIKFAKSKLSKASFVVMTDIEYKGDVISTGVNALDAILGGGLRTGYIYLFTGGPGSGKTQFCMHLAVVSNRPTAIIDTEGAISKRRMEQIASKKGLDNSKVFGRIYLGIANSTTEQFDILENAFTVAEELGIKLLIIDSLTSNFRAEFSEFKRTREKAEFLTKFMNNLKKFARRFDAAVVATTQVYTQIDELGLDGDVFVGGNVVAHASHYIVMLRKGPKDRRIARLIKAPDLPEAETVFAVRDGGVEDV